MEKSCTIQDVFERFYLSYEKRNSPPAHHRKTAYHIMNCKTGAFGVNLSLIHILKPMMYIVFVLCCSHYLLKNHRFESLSPSYNPVRHLSESDKVL